MFFLKRKHLCFEFCSSLVQRIMQDVSSAVAAAMARENAPLNPLSWLVSSKLLQADLPNSYLSRCRLEDSLGSSASDSLLSEVNEVLPMIELIMTSFAWKLLSRRSNAQGRLMP